MSEKLSNIFLFYGENNYLINEKINFWIKKFAEKHGGDMNISIISANESTKANSILSECETMPFLGEKRLIIVRDFLSRGKSEEDREEEESKAKSKKTSKKEIVDQQKIIVEKIEKGIPDSTVLVFQENRSVDKRKVLYKKLNKIGQTEEFNILEGSELVNWIIAKAKKEGSQMSYLEANYLIAQTGSNQWQLANEINKLCLYSKGRMINKNDIDLLTKASLQSNIFRLTDLIGQKSSNLAIKTLEELNESGESINYVFHMIVRQFRIIIQIADLLKQGHDVKTIISVMKLHPFVVTNTAKQARNFTPMKLQNIYKELLEIEIGAKTGKIKQTTTDNSELLLALEKFIIESCRK